MIALGVVGAMLAFGAWYEHSKDVGLEKGRGMVHMHLMNILIFLSQSGQ